MKKQVISQKFNYVERIIHTLMLKSFFTNDLGLMSGKMGISLTMLEYSKSTDNIVLFEYANDLLDNIIENTNKGLSYSFESGLAGIGWGIEYLLQNQFVEGSGIEICEEIDFKLMEIDPKRITDLTLETGIEGLLHYIISHLQGAIKQKNKLPFDELYLHDIFRICKKMNEKPINKSLRYLVEIYQSFFINGEIKYNFSIHNLVIPLPEKLPERLTSFPVGLKDGLAGILLHLTRK